MTLLCLTRVLKFKAEPNFSSITLPFSGVSDFSEFKDFIKIFVKDYNLKLEHPCYDSSLCYITNKAGPKGHALMTSLEHLRSWTGITQLCFIRMLSGFHWTLCQLGKLRPTIKLVKPEIANRKLSVVNDPEGKARVIAIFDYYSQLVLKSLNDQLFNKLRDHFSQDRTFTQDPSIKAEDNNHYHSLDLSSATDRFPVILQRSILAEMLSYDYAYY